MSCESTMVRPQTGRSFRISDALALVAATGLGLAGCRLWLSLSGYDLGDLFPTGDQPLVLGLMTALWAVPGSLILLLSWTSATLLLRLRAPRPQRRHLWCQPGFLACVGAVFVFAWTSFGVGSSLALESLLMNPADLSRLTYDDLVRSFVLILLHKRQVPENVGGAVLLIWLVTWASGRCRPEPSWLDRSGRLLGVVWVCIALLEAFSFLGFA